MTDHDAIAARVRQDRETGTPGPWHHDADDQRRIDYTDPRSGTCWNVAYVHSHCGHPIDGSSANARRIAALPDLEAAYLDLYDEVKRLRAFMRMIVDDRDRTFVLLAERAEKAEAERDALRAVLERCPPTSNPTLSAEYHLERINAWWRLDVHPALAKIKGADQ